MCKSVIQQTKDNDHKDLRTRGKRQELHLLLQSVLTNILL